MKLEPFVFFSSLTSLSDGLALERYRVIDHLFNSLFYVCGSDWKTTVEWRSYARSDKTMEHVLYCIFAAVSRETHEETYQRGHRSCLILHRTSKESE